MSGARTPTETNSTKEKVRLKTLLKPSSKTSENIKNVADYEVDFFSTSYKTGAGRIRATKKNSSINSHFVSDPVEHFSREQTKELQLTDNLKFGDSFLAEMSNSTVTTDRSDTGSKQDRSCGFKSAPTQLVIDKKRIQKLRQLRDQFLATTPGYTFLLFFLYSPIS